MTNGAKKVKIVQLQELRGVEGLVRLTKWLPGLHEEMTYLRNEYFRISADPLRVCMIATHNGKFALYVNDITNGAFNALSEIDEIDE